MWLTIVLWCLALVIYICGGLVCGRICVEIIREKNSDMNEVLWFWAGFLFNVLAVFMTLCVKKRDEQRYIIKNAVFFAPLKVL